MRRKTIPKEQREAERAFSLQQEIEKNESQRRLLLLDIGKNLYEIYEKQYYKDLLGEEDATWSAFLSLPSVFFSRNTIYNLFLVGKKYIKELEIPKEVLMTIPTQRLIEAKEIITKENWKIILEQAKQLTPMDWKIVVREYKGLPTEDSCSHDLANYKICRHCGLKQKNENNS